MYSWGEVIRLATESIDPQDAIQKEYITIIEKAKKIYSKMRKKRKTS
jgi:Ca-activated chloride channel family protein